MGGVIGAFMRSDEVMASLETKPMKFHAYFAIIVSAALFVGWTIIQVISPMIVPWFIFPVSFFAITLAAHFYLLIRPMEWLQLHVVAFVSVNVSLFVTWSCVVKEHPWFAYVALAWAIPFSCHFLSRLTSSSKLLLMHCSAFFFVNGLCFLAWMDFSTPENIWFVFVFMVLSLLLFLHCALTNGFSMFYIHAFIFFDVNLILFFVWVIIDSTLPWISVPVIIWGSLLGVHFKLAKPTPKSQPPPFNLHQEFVIEHPEDEIITPGVPIVTGTQAL
ncbi:hypothetical protein Pelo_13328 [Pelomyxa schiedti]|nr:hypothetical protein Pelo_13328 [Pelomyxa schiedti]